MKRPICSARDKGAGAVPPEADKTMMTLHLEEISKRMMSGAHAIAVMDKAEWRKFDIPVPDKYLNPGFAVLQSRTEPRRECVRAPA